MQGSWGTAPAPAPAIRPDSLVTTPDDAKKWRPPFLFWGFVLILTGFAIYLFGNLLSIMRLLFSIGPTARYWNQEIVWYSGIPTSIGVLLCAIDVFLIPERRKIRRWVDGNEGGACERSRVTVVLTAYNDEASIEQAVKDFRARPEVERVIVVSNNSADRTMQCAEEAGAIAVNEPKPGYGQCVYRCFQEALRYPDADTIVLCEGDCTFRARDIEKLLAFLPHAELVNGTRIVEQLRCYQTQLSTFMYYGNFFAGKLLEIKHLGRGTFTDVGTTYKVLRRQALERIMPHLNPAINLEFNCHFLDKALQIGSIAVECPVTFHARVGESKGGNRNNLRALKVGLRMIAGLAFGWAAPSR
jgi:hypothetical protein